MLILLIIHVVALVHLESLMVEVAVAVELAQVEVLMFIGSSGGRIVGGNAGNYPSSITNRWW